MSSRDTSHGQASADAATKVKYTSSTSPSEVYRNVTGDLYVSIGWHVPNANESIRDGHYRVVKCVDPSGNTHKAKAMVALELEMLPESDQQTVQSEGVDVIELDAGVFGRQDLFKALAKLRSEYAASPISTDRQKTSVDVRLRPKDGGSSKLARLTSRARLVGVRPVKDSESSEVLPLEKHFVSLLTPRDHCERLMTSTDVDLNSLEWHRFPGASCTSPQDRTLTLALGADGRQRLVQFSPRLRVQTLSQHDLTSRRLNPTDWPEYELGSKRAGDRPCITMGDLFAMHEKHNDLAFNNPFSVTDRNKVDQLNSQFIKLVWPGTDDIARTLRPAELSIETSCLLETKEFKDVPPIVQAIEDDPALSQYLGVVQSKRGPRIDEGEDSGSGPV